MANYSKSKLCLMLSGEVLRKRIRNARVGIYDVHPGLVDTKMLQKFFGNHRFPFRNKFLRSPNEAARDIVQLICSESDEVPHKPYFVNGLHCPERASDNAYREQDAELCYEDMLSLVPREIRLNLLETYEKLATRPHSRRWPIRERCRQKNCFTPAAKKALTSICKDLRKSLLLS